MASKETIWRSDDGKLYEKEADALVADTESAIRDWYAGRVGRDMSFNEIADEIIRGADELLALLNLLEPGRMGVNG